MRKLGDRVREQNEEIGRLRVQLDEVTANNDGVVKSLIVEVSKLHEELSVSLAVYKTVGNEKEDLEAQLVEVQNALADTEHSREKVAATD